MQPATKTAANVPTPMTAAAMTAGVCPSCPSWPTSSACAAVERGGDAEGAGSGSGSGAGSGSEGGASWRGGSAAAVSSVTVDAPDLGAPQLGQNRARSSSRWPHWSQNAIPAAG